MLSVFVVSKKETDKMGICLYIHKFVTGNCVFLLPVVL